MRYLYHAPFDVFHKNTDRNSLAIMRYHDILNLQKNKRCHRSILVHISVIQNEKIGQMEIMRIVMEQELPWL